MNKVLSLGVNGFWPYKSATKIAEETLVTHSDPEVAISRTIATHRRWVGSFAPRVPTPARPGVSVRLGMMVGALFSALQWLACCL